jgi:pyridoxal phosphate enzyme (YggS family)
MTIAASLEALRREIGDRVTLVAVSKTHPPELIMEAYQAGQRVFGENRVQELTAKQPLLPADIEWHLIGHLQTNKVKYIAPFVGMIQSVDSWKLLEEISASALRHNRVIDCLLQIYIATEESKFGLDEAEAEEILKQLEANPLPGVRIRGVMGLATFTDDEERIRNEFRGLKSLFERLKDVYYNEYEAFDQLSFGMSSDYRIAVEEGSTMVRIGTRIFGTR